jgi:hypothetical protein
VAGRSGRPFALKRGEPLYVRVPVPADWSDPDGPKIELEGWIESPTFRRE